MALMHFVISIFPLILRICWIYSSWSFSSALSTLFPALCSERLTSAPASDGSPDFCFDLGPARDLRVAGKYGWGIYPPDPVPSKPLVVCPSIKGPSSCEVALSIRLCTPDSSIYSTSYLFRHRSSDIVPLWLASLQCMPRPPYLGKCALCSAFFRWSSLIIPSISCQDPGWYASLAWGLATPGPKSDMWDCETWVHHKLYTWLLQWS